jgi:hypothetical protein
VTSLSASVPSSEATREEPSLLRAQGPEIITGRCPGGGWSAAI